MELNSREIAMSIWLSVFALLLISSKTIRASTLHLVRSLFASKLKLVWASCVLYVTLCIATLFELSILTSDNLKTVAIWFFTFALPSLGTTLSRGEDRSHLINILREAIGANALIAFLMSTYTFSITVELLLVPLILATSIVIAIPTKVESKTFSNVSAIVLLAIGLAFFAKAAHGIATDFSSFATIKTGREFVAPVALTTIYVPFLFCWHIFITYDSGLARARYTIKDETLYKYARAKSVYSFSLDVTGFRKWVKHIAHFRPTSPADIDSGIEAIKRVRRRDLNPFRVPPLTGWLPEHAKNFLKDENLLADDYYQNQLGWSASSSRRVKKDDMHEGQLSYFIRGNELSVTELTLELNVYKGSDEDNALSEFSAVAGKLISRAAYGNARRDQQIEFSLDGTPRNIGKVIVCATKEDWPSRMGGYEICLEIKPT